MRNCFLFPNIFSFFFSFSFSLGFWLDEKNFIENNKINFRVVFFFLSLNLFLCFFICTSLSWEIRFCYSYKTCSIAICGQRPSAFVRTNADVDPLTLFDPDLVFFFWLTYDDHKGSTLLYGVKWRRKFRDNRRWDFSVVLYLNFQPLCVCVCICVTFGVEISFSVYRRRRRKSLEERKKKSHRQGV